MKTNTLRFGLALALCLGLMATPSASSPAQAVNGAPGDPALSGATQVSVGVNHTCAVASGALYCWGVNAYGQLGDGTLVNRLVPTKVAGLSASVTQVAAGDSHTCAALSTGAVKCWGFNLKGQLGNGTTVDSATPVTVTGLSSATQVEAGMYFSCAVDGGKARCWGTNYGGQLGDGTTTDRHSPTAGAGGFTTVTRIATGEAHTCAVADMRRGGRRRQVLGRQQHGRGRRWRARQPKRAYSGDGCFFKPDRH